MPLAGGLVCLVAFLVLTAIVTRDGFRAADALARALVEQWSHGSLRSFMEAASYVGGHPGQISVILLGSVALWPRHRRWALSLPVVMAGAGLLQLTAKWAVERPRPNLDPWGFPSAHVLTLVVLLGYIAYVVGGSSARRAWRTLAVGACVAIVATVAYSRMYLNAHWLSDVLGGGMAGLAYLLLAICLIRSMPLAARPRFAPASERTGLDDVSAAARALAAPTGRT
ncbi:MAG: phosphatase PAP2 family protein, partial [Candidatus Rokuibacteriota bacterium]